MKKIIDNVRCRVLIIWYALTRRYIFLTGFNDVDSENNVKGGVCVELAPKKGDVKRELFLSTTSTIADKLIEDDDLL